MPQNVLPKRPVYLFGQCETRSLANKGGYVTITTLAQLPASMVYICKDSGVQNVKL